MPTHKNAAKSRETALKTFPLDMTLPELVNTLVFNMPYTTDAVTGEIAYTDGRFILKLELTEEQAKRLIPAND